MSLIAKILSGFISALSTSRLH